VTQFSLRDRRIILAALLSYCNLHPGDSEAEQLFARLLRQWDPEAAERLLDEEEPP
jgi:hypothetical protein